MSKKKEKYFSDNELLKVVVDDSLEEFRVKSKSSYLDQIKFTPNIWSILHVTVLYGRIEMTSILLHSPMGIRMLQEKDRNGETPMHLACYNSDYEIASLLLSKGGTLGGRNICMKGPIDVIDDLAERKAFIHKLLGFKGLSDKDYETLKEHADKLKYLESLSEIVNATENRGQFIIDRGHELGQDAQKKYLPVREPKREILNFKLGFKPKEEFFDELKARDIRKKRHLDNEKIKSKLRLNLLKKVAEQPSPFQFKGIPKADHIQNSFYPQIGELELTIKKQYPDNDISNYEEEYFESLSNSEVPNSYYQV